MFHHLLIAALHRAVALEQMHQIAVQVAQNLHFDMARAAHQLFQIHLVVAEGRQRFAARDVELFRQLRFGFDHAHAAPATAPTGFQHQRVADCCGQRLGLFNFARQRAGGRHHRHAGRHRRLARRHLVAQCAHHRRAWVR